MAGRKSKLARKEQLNARTQQVIQPVEDVIAPPDETVPPANIEEPQPRVRGPNHGTEVPQNPNDRTLLSVVDDCFIDTRVTSDIVYIFKGYFNEPWSSWLKVPTEIKDLMWKEFTKKWRWELSSTNEVKRTWNTTCGNRFRDILCNDRKRAAKESKSTNPVDWKGHFPKWMGASVWDQLIDDVWSKDNWQKKSISGKNNRLTLKDGAIPTHTGGSIPFPAHKEKMRKELSRSPTKIELYERTHKKNKGSGDYVCPKAKRVRESYEQNIEDTYADLEERPSFDQNLWSEASGGSSKGRLYGFGSKPRRFELCSTNDGWSATPEANKKIDELEKTLEEMKSKNDLLVNQIQNFELDLPSRLRSMLQELGWTNNIFPGGSGPQEQNTLNDDVDSGSSDDSFERVMKSQHDFRSLAQNKSRIGKNDKRGDGSTKLGRNDKHHRNGGKKK